MPIEFNCEACAQLLRVPDNSEGQACQCPSCQEIIVIPDPAGTKHNPLDAPQATSDGKLTIACPQCSHKLICSPELLGTKGQCRNCHTIFTIAPQGSATTATPIEHSPGWVFNCPKCDQLFEGQAEMEGRKGKCHACGEVFAIELKPATPTRSAARTVTTTPQTAPSELARPSAHVPSQPQTATPASIQFSCQHCQGVMEVPGSTAGRTTQCPYCQQLLNIPRQSTYSRNNLDHAYAAPDLEPAAPSDTMSEWGRPRKKKIRGLSFSNAFELTFASLFPYSLAAAGLFTIAGGLALVLILGAGFLSGFTLQTLQFPPASTAGQTVIFGLLAVAILAAVCLVTAVYCMTCNTALHVIRGKQITGEVLFSTGESYGGMLVIMLGWTSFNVLRQYGVPWVARSLVEAGQQDTAITVALISIGVLYVLQVALTLLLAYVPFALLDGQRLSDAVGTSSSIFVGNFLTVLPVVICGGLLYTLASVLTCGMGFIVFIGSMLYLHAAVYHLAAK